MARTVADAAVLLGALAGSDPGDAATKDADTKGRRDYSSSLSRDGLRGARIGVVRNRLFGYSPAADRLAEAAIADMRRQGAVIVDPANIPTLGKFDDSEFDVLLYEFKADLNAYLASRGPSAAVRSLADLIAFNNGRTGRGTAVLRPGNPDDGREEGAVERGEVQGRTGAESPARANAGHRRRDDEAQAGCAGGADRGTRLADRSRERRRRHGRRSRPFHCHVSGRLSACHRADGIRGRAAGRRLVLRPRLERTDAHRLAYAYEQATKHRRPPAFAPTANVSQR